MCSFCRYFVTVFVYIECNDHSLLLFNTRDGSVVIANSTSNLLFVLGLYSLERPPNTVRVHTRVKCFVILIV